MRVQPDTLGCGHLVQDVHLDDVERRVVLELIIEPRAGPDHLRHHVEPRHALVSEDGTHESQESLWSRRTSSRCRSRSPAAAEVGCARSRSSHDQD
jgi:hypothetical protein